MLYRNALFLPMFLPITSWACSCASRSSLAVAGAGIQLGVSSLDIVRSGRRRLSGVPLGVRFGHRGAHSVARPRFPCRRFARWSAYRHSPEFCRPVRLFGVKHDGARCDVAARQPPGPVGFWSCIDHALVARRCLCRSVLQPRAIAKGSRLEFVPDAERSALWVCSSDSVNMRTRRRLTDRPVAHKTFVVRPDTDNEPK